MRARRLVYTCCFSLFWTVSARAAETQVEVTAKSAKVKVGKEVVGTVKKGQKFRVMKIDGSWIAIRIGKGDKQRTGWVLANAVKILVEGELTDDAIAPDELIPVRLTVDLTQFPMGYGGPQSSMFMKLALSNETSEPLDFKVAEIELLANDAALPQVPHNAANPYYQPVYGDPSMRMQLQPGQLSYLKDGTLPPGETAAGWIAFNISSFMQEFYQPGAMAGKTWVLSGKVGRHPIRLDLKEAEIAALGAKVRPSKIDPSVQVVELGSRLNALNVTKLLESLQTIPPGDRGGVLVMKEGQCLVDGLATQQLQQQTYQLFNQGNTPVVSTEGTMSANQGWGFQGFFGYGQWPQHDSESAAVMTVLGRRPDSGAALIKHLGAETADIRAAAARALLQHLAESGVVEALTKSAADAEVGVRSAALTALGGPNAPAQMRQDDSIDTRALVQGMQDANESVRTTAAQSASAFPNDTIRRELVKLLDDSSLGVKYAAAASAGTLQAKAAIPKLQQLQTTGDQQLKTIAIDALKTLGELTPVAAALAKLDGGFLQDSDYQELGKAKDRSAVPLLITRLKVNDNYQVGLAGRTLGEIGDTRAVEPLLQALQFGNRNYGMVELPRALGKLGDKKAIAPLKEMLALPQQNFPSDLRMAIFEALLLLKAPSALDDAIAELKQMEAANRTYEANPLLVALGRSRYEKAIPILEKYLENQQSCLPAAEGLIQMGTRKGLAALEKRLVADDYQFGQMVILNRQWANDPASLALLRKLAAAGNPNTRNAASNALANAQASRPGGGPMTKPSPVGYPALLLQADAWVNGPPMEAAETLGKVVLLLLPAEPLESPPTLPEEANAWQQRFGEQGLVIASLARAAGWVWDAAAEDLSIAPDVPLDQQRQAVAEMAKARGINYRIGLLKPASTLIEQFGGSPLPRVALIDRAGILQSVRPLDAPDASPTDLESLLEELLKEPAPSTATLQRVRELATARQAAPGPEHSSHDSQDHRAPLDAAAPVWTIPAHQGVVWATVFSPDGKSIATTSEDMLAKVWNATTGDLTLTLRGHTGLVRSVSFTRDGKQLLTSGFDNTIRVWDAASGELQKTLTDDQGVYSLGVLGDERTVIASSNDSRLRVWNLPQGRLEGYFVGHGSAVWAAASTTVRGKSTVISGSTDKTAKLWDFETGGVAQTLSGHQFGVTAVAISGDATVAASGAFDGEVILWDTATGRAEQTIPGAGAVVYEAAFSPDGKTLAVGRGDHSVTLYDVPTGKARQRLHRGGWSVRFSPDGQRLATGGDDRTLRVWKISK
ncbi:MAG: HEAT repeat domain-containing protein [Planctomycetales bacterium]